MDIEKANLYNAYRERIGEILVGEVYQVWKKEVLVLDEDGNELLMPKTEQFITSILNSNVYNPPPYMSALLLAIVEL